MFFGYGIMLVFEQNQTKFLTWGSADEQTQQTPESCMYLRTVMEQERQAKHPSKSSLSKGYVGVMFIFPDARGKVIW